MASTHTQGLIEVDAVIRGLCKRMGDPLATKYDRYYHMCEPAIREMSKVMDMGGCVVEKWIDVDPDTRRIDFPSDYVKYRKIGFVYNGNFIALGANPKMGPLPQDNCGNYSPVVGGNSTGALSGSEVGDAEDSDGIPYGIPVWGYWDDNVAYGAGGGWSQEGYFRENKQTRTFDFSGGMRFDRVWIRYESTGFQTDAKNYIYVACQQALEMGILWFDSIYGFAGSKTNEDLRAQQVLERSFRQAVSLAVAQVHGSTQREMIDARRQLGGRAPRP